MKATIKPENNINGKAHRLEKHFKESYLGIAVDAVGRLFVLVDIRVYQTQARTFACAWVRSPKRESCIGSSSVNGLDYSKAIEVALSAAGITFDQEITGYSGRMGAVNAICSELGYQNPLVFCVAG